VLRTAYYGIWSHPTSGVGVVHAFNVGNWSSGGTMNTFFRSTDQGHLIAMNCAFMNGSATYGYVCDGASSTMTLDYCSFRSSAGTAVYANNGAFIRAAGMPFSRAINGIEVGPSGSNTRVYAVGCAMNPAAGQISAYHIKINAGANLPIVQFTGTIDETLILDGGTGTILGLSGTTEKNGGGLVVFNELWLGTLAGTIPVGEYLRETGLTGYDSGGAVTNAGGLTVDIATGGGWINTGTGLNHIMWAAQLGFSLTDNSENYVYIDQNGDAQKSASEPNHESSIILAEIVTSSGSIILNASHRIPVAQRGALFHIYAQEVLQNRLVTGMTVSATSPASLGFVVDSGFFYLADNRLSTTASADPCVFTLLYRDGLGGWVAVAGQTTVPLQFDDNSGTPVALSPGEWAKHMSWVTQGDDGTQWFVQMGQEVFASKVLAEAGNNPAPFEFLEDDSCRLYGLVINDTSTTIESFVRSVLEIGVGGGGSTGVSAHGALSGLSGDDHPQYALLTGNAVRNLISGSFDFASGGITLPTNIAPAQTAEGEIIWDSVLNKLTVGDGASRKTMMNSGDSAGGDLNGTYPNPGVKDLTITSEVQGSTLYYNGSNWVQLSPGTAGQFLKTNGAAANPQWNAIGIRSSGTGAFDVTLANTENLSAGRTLTLKLNNANRIIDIADNIALAGSLTTVGANSLSFTTTGATSLTLPTSGTLINSTDSTLQLAYNNGPTITTAAATPITLNLSSGGLTVNGTGAVDIGNDATVQTLNFGTGAAAKTVSIGSTSSTSSIDINSGTGSMTFDAGGIFDVNSAGVATIDATEISLDGTLASNFSTTSAALTISTITSGTLSVTSAGALNLSGTTGDWQSTGALTIDSTSTIGIGTDADSQAINIGTGAAARAITVGNTTGATAVVVNAGTGASSTNITGVGTYSLVAGTGTINIATNATDHSTIVGSVTGASPLTLQSGTGAMTLTAGGIFDVNSTGALTLDSTSFSIDGTLASNISTTSSNLTLSTITSGTLAVSSAGVVNISSTSTTDMQSTGALTIDSSSTIGIGTDADAQAINIGTGAAARTITIGNATGATSVAVNGGTGAMNFGTNAVAHTTTIGTTTGAAATTLQSGTGAMTFTAGGAYDVNATGAVTIDSSGGTIGVGTDAVAQAINLGTGAAARTLTIGNGTGATAIIVSSGTEKVQIDNITHYGKSATNPTARAGGFQDGDLYYNTALHMQMAYDSSRAKWLSVQSETFSFGRNGNTLAAGYYQGTGSISMSSTIGYTAENNGCIVAMGYTRSDVDAATFDIVEGGTSRATLASSAVSGSSATLNGNFSSGGVLAVQNQSGGNTTSNVLGWVKVKWRI
jgi:hypothetical protein